VDIIEEGMMKSLRLSFIAVFAATATLVAGAAWAHAMLDHAVPGVGATVQASPAELRISFSENIVASFSSAKLATAEGAAIPTGKAVVDQASPNVLRVPIGQKLKPGTYVVTWHVVSADTHSTSGSYKFTVAP
jgi:methionine-rich copper-binding protein CopC